MLQYGGLKQVLVTTSGFGERQDKLYSMWGTNQWGQIFETSFWFRAADIIKCGLQEKYRKRYIYRHIDFMSQLLKIQEQSTRLLPAGLITSGVCKPHEWNKPGCVALPHHFYDGIETRVVVDWQPKPGDVILMPEKVARVFVKMTDL